MKSKIEKYVKDRTNVLLIGPAGVGKTQIMEQVLTAEFGKNGYVVIHGATTDPYVDLVGLPYAKKQDDGEEILGFLRPRLWSGEIRAIFVDEFNRAPKAVRNAIMELSQFRTINGIHTNVEIVCAAINPEDDETDLGEQMYNVERLDPAQKDRFPVWLTFPNDIDDDYFSTKYGNNIAAAAREFWATANVKDRTRLGITPRRIDYAVEIVLNGGWIEDVIPSLPGASNFQKAIIEASVGLRFVEAIKNKDIKAITEFVNGKNSEAVLASAPTMKTEKTCIEYLADDRIIEALSKYSWFINSSLYSDDELKRYKTMYKTATLTAFAGEKLKLLTLWGNVNGKLYPLTDKFTKKVKSEGWTLPQLANKVTTDKDAFYALYALKHIVESQAFTTATFVSTVEKFIDIYNAYPATVADDDNEEALIAIIDNVKQYIADNSAEDLTKALGKTYRTDPIWVKLTGK